MLPFLPFPLLGPPPPAPTLQAAAYAPVVSTSPVRDLLLTEAGNLWVYGGDLWLVGGVDAIAQECGTALRLFRDEAIMDAQAGLPWPELLARGVSNATIAAAVRAQLLTVPGIASVDNVTVADDTLARTATIGADVTTTDGVQLTVTQERVGT